MEKDEKIMGLPADSKMIPHVSSLTISRGTSDIEAKREESYIKYNGDYEGNHDGDVIIKTIDGVSIKSNTPILNFMGPLIDVSLNTISGDEMEPLNLTFNFDGCDVSDPLKQKIGSILEKESDIIRNSILELTGMDMRLVPPVWNNDDDNDSIYADIQLYKKTLSKKIEKHSCFNRCYEADKVFKTYPGLKDILFNNCVGSDGYNYAKLLYSVELEMKINPVTICDNIVDFLRRTAKNFFADKNINIIIKEYMFIKLKKWLYSYYRNKCYFILVDKTRVSSVMLQRSISYDYRKLYKLLGVIRELRNV